MAKIHTKASVSKTHKFVLASFGLKSSRVLWSHDDAICVEVTHKVNLSKAFDQATEFFAGVKDVNIGISSKKRFGVNGTLDVYFGNKRVSINCFSLCKGALVTLVNTKRSQWYDSL